MKKIKQTTTFDPEHPYPITPEPSNAFAQWDALGDKLPTHSGGMSR